MGWDRTKRDEPIWDGGEGTGDETDRTEWDEIRTGPLVDVMKCLFVSDVRTCSPEEGRAVSAMT